MAPCIPFAPSVSTSEAQEGLEARVLAKLEYFNPAGSAKDRVGRAMLAEGEASGRRSVHPGIDLQAGRFGALPLKEVEPVHPIGLAAVAAARGYRIIIVMPETMSMERRKLMKA